MYRKHIDEQPTNKFKNIKTLCGAVVNCSLTIHVQSERLEEALNNGTSMCDACFLLYKYEK